MALCYNLIIMRVRMIKEILDKKRSVNEVADIMWVSRKTVHMWKCRYKTWWEEWMRPRKPWPKSWSAWNRTKKEIEDKLVDYAHSNPLEWPVRISIWLEDEHWIKINQATIYRILKRRNIRYFNEYKKKKRKKKLYVLGDPWREVQIDTSFPYGRKRKFVIYSAIDDCTRKVFCKSYERHWIRSTKRFLKDLIEYYPFQIKSIRTDQWSEFSRTISEHLEMRWINHIRNQAYHPEHNWKVERYHRTMKREAIRHRKKDISIKESNYYLWLRTAYYNRSRRHTGMWMNKMTPDEKLRRSVTLILQ